MTEKNKSDALSIINKGVFEIISSYSENALLINACFVAKDRYALLEGEMQLSTTQNVPQQLRLDMEIEVVYRKNELVTKYGGDVLDVVFRNYIISNVSIVDAILEDLYEDLLKVVNPAITDTELEKQIRNAWTNEAMLNFFVDAAGAGLTKPTTKTMEFAEAYMRYTELRIVRHTLLHSDSTLSAKNLKKLQDNFTVTPVARRHFALISSPMFDPTGKVNLSINHILAIRQYLHRYLMYLRESINEKVIR